ncbi:short-chain dehydrogenase/reductase [Castellaniella sp. GW247-6E4]|uniref:short-chain dehydrogenase/reductase n=1 Tax=Castellaniella sp. GW247-6E4 TaxID=3140380 RepID=UPI003315BBF9
MELNLKGKTALITGGSRGIGYAIAESMAAEGCRVQIVGRNPETLARARTALAETGAEATTHCCDLSDPDASTAFLDRLDPNIDILVNNAGAIPRGRLTELGDTPWRASWELKMFSYINLCRAVYSHMRDRKRGVIINIVGAGGERPTAAYIAGSTANAALMAFTRALGGESVDYGVRVLAINPGLTETERMRTLLEEDSKRQLGSTDRWRELTSSRPFGRAARAEEIAAVATFMASERASYVSGTVITVDGGSTTRHPPI